MELEGRAALVTGAAAGTGRAIAHRLVRGGARVVLSDLDEVAGAAAAQGMGARFVRADMRVPADVERLVAAVEPEILVNNAGGGGDVPPHFPDAPAEDWGATLDLNLRAPMLATQLVIRRGAGGAVVNVASTAGLGLAPYSSPEYGAAKAGLIRFTSCLAGCRGARVNCVVPDWIATERAQAELAAMTPDERAAAPEPIPMAEVAEAVAALIADDALSGRVMVLPGPGRRHLLAPEAMMPGC